MPKCNLRTFLVNCHHDDRNPQHEFSKSNLVTQIKHHSNNGKWKIWPLTWPQKQLAKSSEQRTLIWRRRRRRKISGITNDPPRTMTILQVMESIGMDLNYDCSPNYPWTSVCSMIPNAMIIDSHCGELNEITSDSSLCVHNVWQICAWQIGRYLVLFICLDYHLLQLLPDSQHLRIFLIRYLKWMHYVVHYNPIATWLFFWHLFPENSPSSQSSLNFGAQGNCPQGIRLATAQNDLLMNLPSSSAHEPACIEHSNKSEHVRILDFSFHLLKNCIDFLSFM